MNKIKHLLFISFLLTGFVVMAHQVNYSHTMAHEWHLNNGNSIIGYFSYAENGEVCIENTEGKYQHIPFKDLTENDRVLVARKIRNVNEQMTVAAGHSSTKYFWISGLLACLFLFLLFKTPAAKRLWIYPICLSGLVMLTVSFTHKIMKAGGTDPAFITAAFAPFVPAVHTHYDSTYFYVESIGIVNHPMMAGITSWQQQVPISQCYIGTNAWSIPLYPVNADTAVPVNQKHFLRGAVAIAANGIAIFNPYTNTGVDALLDGQLDHYGGHCGRADDYHYHVAPLHLDSQTTDILPIAFALDGYAVYAGKEPDGTNMKALDVNHGHVGSNGVYHYHGTSNAPYMIGNMVGKVTEDTTLQIIPQAAAKPIRPAGTPLKGAVITNCIPNGTGNGYNLVYTLNGVTDSVSYAWSPSGAYTFNFYVSGNKTTNNYNGSAICKVPFTPTGLNTIHPTINLQIYPNPAQDYLIVKLPLDHYKTSLTEIYSLKGDLIASFSSLPNKINTSGMTNGIYILKTLINDQIIFEKFIVNK